MVDVACLSLFLLFVFSDISNSDISLRFFKEKYIMKKSVAFNGLEREFKSRNMFTCAGRCLMNKKCKSYFFNKVTNTCVLQGRYFEVETQTHIRDWTYCTTQREDREGECVTELDQKDFNATLKLWIYWFHENAEECKRSCIVDKRCVFFIFDSISQPSRCMGIYFTSNQSPNLYKDCRARGYYHSSCKDTSSCKFKAAVCLSHRCVCPLKHYFSPGKRKCVKPCPNYMYDTPSKTCDPKSKRKQCVAEEHVSVSNPMCAKWYPSDQPYPGRNVALWVLESCRNVSSCHKACLRDVRCIRFAFSEQKECIGLSEEGKKLDKTTNTQYDLYVNCRFAGYVNMECFAVSDCCFEGASCLDNRCVCDEGYFHQGTRACTQDECDKCGSEFYLVSPENVLPKKLDKAEFDKCLESKKSEERCPFIFHDGYGTCETVDAKGKSLYQVTDGMILARTCLASTTDEVFAEVAGFVKGSILLSCPSTRVFYRTTLLAKLNNGRLWGLVIEEGAKSRCERLCLKDERCVLWRLENNTCCAYSKHYKSRPFGVRAGIYLNKNCRA